jgi:hypothetical protein
MPENATARRAIGPINVHRDSFDTNNAGQLVRMPHE